MGLLLSLASLSLGIAGYRSRGLQGLMHAHFFEHQLPYTPPAAPVEFILLLWRGPKSQALFWGTVRLVHAAIGAAWGPSVQSYSRTAVIHTRIHM